MVRSAQAIRCRFRPRASQVGLAILAGTVLGLAGGCSDFAAQGRNAEGVRLFNQARYHEALRQFEEAAYTDPSDSDGYYNLAATYHRLGAVEQSDDYLRQAEQYYHMCLDRGDCQADAYRGLAVLLAEQGRNDEAFRLLEGWADSQPGAADPKIELARLFEETGDRNAAKEHLIEAVGVDPDNPRALAALGRIREQTGDAEQALVDYERSLWYDRSQSEVAARVATLRASAAPTLSATGADGGTRLVERSSDAWR